MHKRFQLFLLIIFATLATDQLTKLWIIEHPNLPIVMIRDIFQIIFFRNNGIAFSIPLPELIIAPLVVLIILIGGWYLHRELDLRRPLAWVAIALILGGTIGNLLDRFRLGYVVDFIAVWKFPVFNVADIAITGGMLMLVLWYGALEKRKG